MERSRAVLITLVCVLFSRISGVEVEMRVRPGDNVVLHSDCVWKKGFNTVWFRNASNEQVVFHEEAHPRYSIVWNPFNRASDLLVRNVSESDLGLYHCALQKKSSAKDKTQACSWEDVCVYGNRTTRVSFLDTLQIPSTPSVSDCSVCWKLLVSVCPVCVLLSSTCVCCICRYTTTVGRKHDSAEPSCDNTKNPTSRRQDKVGGDDVCYASLDHQNRGQKRLKKKRDQSSDFTTYSGVIYSGKL
ncbi:uncharacterized protein LOC108439032 isoform X1 [Pygocentrus nattereri]|uniref:uncharacterized protein LOC108439032 isoform X1 n=1 Tax=Pygocentrus nattereri TaxID=42514 RepID=UPI000814B4A6|nr:uncharacterized protein LOC108439032 isoform X1 [Pygocentrus nattereri]